MNREQYQQKAKEEYEKMHQKTEIVKIVEKLHAEGKSMVEITETAVIDYTIKRLCEISYPDDKDIQKRNEMHKVLKERAEKLQIKSFEQLPKNAENCDANGMYSPTENTIYVRNTSINIEEYTGTLVHEVLHGLSHVYGLPPFIFRTRHNELLKNKPVNEAATIYMAQMIAGTTNTNFGGCKIYAWETDVIDSILTMCGMTKSEFARLYTQTDKDNIWMNQKMCKKFSSKYPDALILIDAQLSYMGVTAVSDAEHLKEIIRIIDGNKEYCSASNKEVEKCIDALELGLQYRANIVDYPRDVRKDKELMNAFVEYKQNNEMQKEIM